MKLKEIQFEATPVSGKVSALLMMPSKAKRILVLAHGAGAGMHHKFMNEIAEHLADQGIGTLRYQFPYMENGLRRPDSKPVLFGTVRSAVALAGKMASGLPLLAGGKSMGGRMTSMAQAEEPLTGVKGIVFFGFPLHPAGQPATDRAEHLGKVKIPMLFLQGTRDTLADLKLLKPVCKKLGKRATLHIVNGADHSFNILKSSDRTNGDVLEELAHQTASWSDSLP